jgi:hypothetical protein
VCSIVYKITSELECVILITLFLVGAKNTDTLTLLVGSLRGGVEGETLTIDWIW